MISRRLLVSSLLGLLLLHVGPPALAQGELDWVEVDVALDGAGRARVTNQTRWRTSGTMAAFYFQGEAARRSFRGGEAELPDGRRAPLAITRAEGDRWDVALSDDQRWGPGEATYTFSYDADLASAGLVALTRPPDGPPLTVLNCPASQAADRAGRKRSRGSGINNSRQATLMSQTIKSIAYPKLSLNILSEAEVHQIHTATLEVIESVGVRFPSQKALDILEAHGAQVNRQSMVARIPGQTVETYLAKAPPTYTLAALDPALNLPLDGNHSYLGTDGCGVEILDAFSGERRRTTKQDLLDVPRVADYLEGIAFHWVPISAQDCPPHSRSLHELEAVWQVSRKHVQTETIVNEPEMRAAIEMAAALVGGRKALKDTSGAVDHAMHHQSTGARRW